MADTDMVGLDEVLRNLNREIKGLEDRTQVGLLKAGFFVEAEATKNAPLFTGNLRGSAYTRNVGIMEGGQGGVEVGFEAEYALWVHEIDNDYRNGEWKYLQRAIDENADIIIDIIREEASVD
jgi:hypothetical protein